MLLSALACIAGLLTQHIICDAHCNRTASNKPLKYGACGSRRVIAATVAARMCSCTLIQAVVNNGVPRMPPCVKLVAASSCTVGNSGL